MATFKACVQKQRQDGFYPVYVRVTHERKIGYIKTDKVVSRKDVSKNKEIRDNYVLNFCTQLILEYTAKINTQNIKEWNIKRLIDFLTKEDDDICFSDYARKHIAKMFSNGQERNSRNYELAVNHLERFLGTTQVMFSQLTSTAVNLWIKSLETTHRAKEMYPVCVRQIFKAAIMEYNDYDNGLIKDKDQPLGQGDHTAVRPNHQARHLTRRRAQILRRSAARKQDGRPAARTRTRRGETGPVPCRHQHHRPLQYAEKRLL